MKKQIPTLKERVSQISIGAFLLTVAVLLTSFTLYSMKKAKIAEDHVVEELTSNVSNQVNQFLPSFLLPEQKQGISLLLERIKQNEDLADAKIVNKVSDLDGSFANCLFNGARLTSCTSSDQKFTAIIVPLKESDELFGYLFKSKKNLSPNSLKDVLELAGLILFVLGIVFIGIYIFISRLLSQTLPRSLDNLVKLIETEINGGKTENVELQFKEVENLYLKI